MAAAEAIVIAVGAYAGLGLLFALWFVSYAVQRFDDAASGSGVAFRILILPGVAALWPILLSRWLGRRCLAHD